METRAAVARRAAAAAAATPAISSAASGSSTGVSSSPSVAASPAPSPPAAVTSTASSSAPPAGPAATGSARGKRGRDESTEAEESKGDVAIARRTATSTADTSASMEVSSSPLLRCMRGCRDIQFHLMQLLDLGELAALDATCRIWRGWLLHPPLVDGLNYSIRPTSFPSLLLSQPCDWARQLVAVISDVNLDSDDLLPEPQSSVGKQEAIAACDQLLLRVLPRFPRLGRLTLKLCNSVVSEDTLRQCFITLAPILKDLYVWSYGAGEGFLVNRVLQQLPQLTRLESLWVTAHRIDWTTVNLWPLAQLPALSFFTCSMDDDRPTPAQVDSLLQCRSLTGLGCGSWSPQAEADAETQRQQIEQGIAGLVRSRLPSASGAEPTCAPLDDLDLRDTDMSAAVWEHVSQLTTLISLEPLSWRSDISQAQWSRLARLPQLTNLKVRPHPDDSDTPLLPEHYLSHALQCGLIQYLTLGPGARLSRLQLQSIARQLPWLHSLRLDGVWLENGAPLGQVARLASLYLLYCDGPRAAGDPPVQFRALLPSLPRLRYLAIYDRCRITAEQAAPLNEALMARMPFLTMDDFEQNLLAPAPAPDPPALAQPAAAAAAVVDG